MRKMLLPGTNVVHILGVHGKPLCGAKIEVCNPPMPSGECTCRNCLRVKNIAAEYFPVDRCGNTVTDGAIVNHAGRIWEVVGIDGNKLCLRSVFVAHHRTHKLLNATTYAKNVTLEPPV